MFGLKHVERSHVRRPIYRAMGNDVRYLGHLRRAANGRDPSVEVVLTGPSNSESSRFSREVTQVLHYSSWGGLSKNLLSSEGHLLRLERYKSIISGSPRGQGATFLHLLGDPAL